jgi:hypothetical protein
MIKNYKPTAIVASLIILLATLGTTPARAADDGSIIDVLVAYTPQARDEAGGTSAAMNAFIWAHINEVNTVLANSGALFQFRLVGTKEVVYTEEPTYIEIMQHLQSTDGVMDELLSLRDSSRADLVHVIFSSYEFMDSCGSGFVLRAGDASAANWGFSISNFSCDNFEGTKYQIAHSLGHNFGLQHNADELDFDGRGDVPPPGITNYAYGYVDPQNRFRDIMANDCPTPGPNAIDGVYNCPRAPFFSSTTRTYGGLAIGNTLSADATRVMNERRVQIANFRDSTGGPTPGDTPTGSPNPDAGVVRHLVWQHTDGRVYDWSMNGATQVAGSFVYASPLADWKVKGSGDFNWDGKLDLVRQHTDGRVNAWFMNGVTPVGDVYLRESALPDWLIVGTDDFNGDGNADLVWQHAGGQVAVWFMAGSILLGNASINVPVPGWLVVGTGDFNGDGKTDIVLQNLDGRVDVWYLNGATYVSRASIVAQQQTDMKLVAVGDFDGDGKPDLVWQHIDGRVDIWFMNGVTGTSQALAYTMPNSGWKIVATRDAKEKNPLAAADYHPLAPCRVLDTRNTPNGTYAGPALAGGATRLFPLGGKCNVPATATSVMVNLTVTAPSAEGYLTVYPAGSSRPDASAANFMPGETRANTAVVAPNLYVYTGLGSGATVHFILDVVGYFE